MDIFAQLSEAVSREQAQNLPTPPSGSTSEASLEDIPSNNGHQQQQQHQHDRDRSRSTSQPTPPSDSRAANVHGQSPVTHPHPPPPQPHPDPHAHPNQRQTQSQSQSQRNQGQTQGASQGQTSRAAPAPGLPRYGAFTLDWQAAQDLMTVLQHTRVGYNTGERREKVRDLNPAVLRAHFPRTYARAFGPEGVGNTAEDMRAWRHIHGDGDDDALAPAHNANANAPIEPLGPADEMEVHDLDEEEMMGGDFPYPHTPEDVVWILVLGKSLLSEMDFLGMADEEQARVDSLPHPPHSHSHSRPPHPSRYPPGPPSKAVKQEPISQTNSPLLPLRAHLRASSSPGASSSSSKSSSSDTVIKSELSSS